MTATATATTTTTPWCCVTASLGLLTTYHVRLVWHERYGGRRTWRSAQADTREAWAQFVRREQNWLYAIQTLRNAITAQTFLATTVLSLLTVISGRLWETLGIGVSSTSSSTAIGITVPQIQFALVALSMVTSAYQFLQSARLMTHAGFMFPVCGATSTKVDRIMRRSQTSQWLGLRCLYLAFGFLSWIAGGPKVFLGTSLLLTAFFRSMDRVPEGIEEESIFHDNI